MLERRRETLEPELGNAMAKRGSNRDRPLAPKHPVQVARRGGAGGSQRKHPGAGHATRLQRLRDELRPEATVVPATEPHPLRTLRILTHSPGALSQRRILCLAWRDRPREQEPPMSETAHEKMSGQEHGKRSRPYLMFWIMMGLSLLVMYAAMFTMIDGWGDFRNNPNMLYMTITMWAPMGIIMLLAMRGMYQNKRANIAMLVVFALLAVGSLGATRAQALIGDRAFIDSMIPHHSGAILMCREAALTDPELIELCEEISDGQREEIQQMQQIRDRLD